MKHRWDYLYETKSRPIRDWALDELADELATQLKPWPPAELEWIDAREEDRFRPAMERPSRPPLETTRVATELARLELLHEVETIDAFLRSADAKAHLPDELEEMSALFLSKWIVESCMSLKEATMGKFKQRDLVELVERLETRLMPGAAPLRITIKNS